MNDSNSVATATASNTSNSLSGGQTVVSLSGLSTCLIAASKFLPDVYQEVATTIAPLLSGIIIYFGVGLITHFGFEDSELVQKRRRYEKDIKRIDKELKKKNLSPETIEMLNIQRHDTLKLLFNKSY